MRKLFLILTVLFAFVNLSTPSFANDREKDFWVDHALDVIESTYGDRVVVKHKDLLKFGRNETTTNAATGSTIMTFAGTEDHETYVSSNLIDTLSSSSTSDVGQTITVEGHTVDGSGDFTFVTQNATINGQNKVVLTTPLARMTRLYNAGDTDLVGAIYGYQEQSISSGVPQTANKVHCIIPAGKQQSYKAATTLSSVDYWVITKTSLTVLEKTATFAEIELQIREKGGVFRPVNIMAAGAGDFNVKEFLPYIIVKPNSDVRLVAIGSADNLDVAGAIHGFLVIKQNAN